MLSKILDRLRQSASFASQYSIGMSNLYQSGVLEFLRANGTPKVVGLGANVQIMATQAAHSAGYNQALDDLMYFIEYFINPPSQKDVPPMDYGGISIALEKGDLLEEEANAIRSDRSPDYSAYTKSKSSSSNNG